MDGIRVLRKGTTKNSFAHLPYEDTAKRWSLVNQEADPHQTLNLLGLGLPSLRTCDK